MLINKLLFLSQIDKLFNPAKLANPDRVDPSLYRKIFPPVMHGSIEYQIFAVIVLSIFVAMILLFIRMIYKRYQCAKANVDTFERTDRGSKDKHGTRENKNTDKPLSLTDDDESKKD